MYRFIQLSSHPAIHTLCIFFSHPHISPCNHVAIYIYIYACKCMCVCVYPNYLPSIYSCLSSLIQPPRQSPPPSSSLPLLPLTVTHLHIPPGCPSLPPLKKVRYTPVNTLVPCSGLGPGLQSCPFSPFSFFHPRHQPYNSLRLPGLSLQPGSCLLGHLTHKPASPPLTE